MTNGIPNVPKPPDPANIASMAMADLNAGIAWAIAPINYTMGWVNQGVSWVTSLPGRAISAVRPGGM